MAGFEMDTGSKDDSYKTYTFPVTTVGNNAGAANPWGHSSAGKYPLSKQKFNTSTSSRATDGRIVVPLNFSNIVLRLNASGTTGSDKWVARSVVAHIQAVDSSAPSKLAVSVAQGIHARGNDLYVSVAFSEPVTCSSATLSTTWSTLSYVSGNGSNVLAFKGTISDAASGYLSITNRSGTVTDLVGNPLNSLAAATWIGRFLGDWDTAANWDIGYLPTSATVVTFTNNAEVGINQALCKEIVLADNSYVAITPARGVSEPLLHFSGNGNYTDAVSGSGTLAVNYIGLFNDNYSGELEIGTAFEILNDITFRGNASGSTAASFVITNKTVISADAWVKSIDKASTLFAEGIDVAKGVTAYMKTLNYGRTKIGYEDVTLVANDGEGNPTAIWLMRSGASLNYGAKVVVDADHAADFYVNTREDSLEGGTYTVYEALPMPTVVSVAATGATVTGVTSGQRVVPGENLTIGATGLAEGHEAVLVITKHSDASELVNTKELPCVYAVPDFDIDVTVTAVKKGYNDPQGNEIQDPGVVSWLSDNGFTQDDIDDLGNDAAATDRLYECWLLGCDFRVPDAGGALSITGIAVSNGVVSLPVQFVRKAPLGRINGFLYFHGAETLPNFGPIDEVSVSFGENDDEFFNAVPAAGVVTQTVTAAIVHFRERFFKAAIEVERNNEPEGPLDEPIDDPVDDPVDE